MDRSIEIKNGVVDGGRDCNMKRRINDGGGEKRRKRGEWKSESKKLASQVVWTGVQGYGSCWR